ncbi:hypothetical protein BRDI103020_17260 [Brevundimonas diminuta]
MPKYRRFTDMAVESSTRAVFTSPSMFSIGKVTPSAGSAFTQAAGLSKMFSLSA